MRKSHSYRWLQLLIGISLSGVLAISCNKGEEAQPQPTLTSLSISEGEAGATVTLTGTNFGTTPADVKVSFGTVQSVISTVTASQITTTVPTNIPAGTVDVKVKVKALETSSLSFTVLAPITVSVSNFTSNIEENPALGQVIGTVQATTNRGSLTYSLSSLSRLGAIAIDPATGQVKVAKPEVFDFEDFGDGIAPSITAVVSAANGTEVASAAITLNLTDAEEVSLAALSFTIAENPAAGSTIGSIDCCWIGATPSFVVLNSTPAGAVTVSNNGELTVNTASAFDFEVNPAITGTYQVTSMSESRAAAFTITLTDVNESPEQYINTTYSIFSGEGATSGCADGINGNIRYTTPNFGHAVTVAGSRHVYLADLHCGAREVTLSGANITSTTLQANNSPSVYEYVDMLYLNTYSLITYRGVANGQGNVLVVPTTGNVSNFSSSTLFMPGGLATNGDGNIYVSGFRTVRQFDSGGTLLNTWGDDGAGYQRVDGESTVARFKQPTDVQVDGNGSVLVADQDAVRRISSDGSVTTIANGFAEVAGITLNPDNNAVIVVADKGSNKIKLIDHTGQVFTLIENLPSPPKGVIMYNGSEFYFTLHGQPALYKATINWPAGG
ncbi:MAG: IPT/TIG domain-containing protein [Cyclobacteriaceae bacterium]|nr:IPT/TIG domain-containing protein [Cyclobacteriaceae bacterium]